jgi:hypothetical protein
VFRLEEERTVSNDWVVRYDNRFLQLERQSGHAPARSKVVVCESVDGQLEIRYRDRVMRWTEITPSVTARVRSDQPAVRPPSHTATRPRRRYHPSADHPWHKHRDMPGPPIWQVRDR